MVKELDFGTEKLRLMRKGYDFKMRSGKNYTDWEAKKGGILTKETKLFRVMNGSPIPDDLKKFVSDSKNVMNYFDEIILIAPSCDKKLLKAFIQNSGILFRGKLSEMIKIRYSQPTITSSIRKEIKEVAKEVAVKEARKEAKKVVIKAKDYELVKEIVKAGKNFTITTEMNEKMIELSLHNWLRAQLEPRGIKVEYEKSHGSGRLDIVVGKNKVGVELKLVKQKGDLQRLLGQVDEYLETYKNIVVIIINAKRKSLDFLNFYVKKLEGKGVEVIVR